MKFKLWLLESELSDYDKVKNYAMHLAKDNSVSLDDVATLLNVLKSNLKKADPSSRVNLFSDYQPILKPVFSKLSTEDKADAEKMLDRMFDDDTFRHPMAVYGHTSPQINMEEMERIMHTIMDRDYDPVIVDRFIQKYKDTYKFVSEDLKREFFTWFQDKIRRMGDTKTLGNILADLFKQMDPED